MGVRYSISSESNDCESEGWVSEYRVHFWPEETAGRIILAKCQGDQKGADVAIANSDFKGEKMPISMAHDLMSKAYFKKRLNVWESIELPITLTEGEIGTLRFLARPVIWLSLARHTDTSPEDYLY